MDAHCKFEFWGIQIYAAIDQFFPRVMWIYVGISSRSAVPVSNQYISMLASDALPGREFARGGPGRPPSDGRLRQVCILPRSEPHPTIINLCKVIVRVPALQAGGRLER
ncbi:hypothetical protein K470DRAFT_264913 [Piedraia hortae CBS 480.64]|uniref:Uncharacterized protein n=1 Tax=Piedraia hortae CBS 480.64 TaxID=1314780 RepID=A0A6A7BXU9_9PEZI|nr:hypothetical protein K470DRAFT_264913 [Piedraia hortae CBS 480.64]